MRGGMTAAAALVVLLAGCTSTISGQAGPAAGDLGAAGVPSSEVSSTPAPSSPAPTSPAPTTTEPAPPTEPERVATPEDLPDLVVVVEAVFDAFSVADYPEVCRYFDLGQEPPPEGLLADCAAAVQQGFDEGSAGSPPEVIEAGRQALTSLSVDVALVELDGPRAVVTNEAIISTEIPDRGFYGSDIGLVLTDVGWRVDPNAF